MTQKQIYLENLAAQMRSEGTNNWSTEKMADLCDLAGLWKQWLDTVTKYDKWRIVLKAASNLGVEIRR